MTNPRLEIIAECFARVEKGLNMKSTGDQKNAIYRLHKSLTVEQWGKVADWMIRNFQGFVFPIPSQWGHAVEEVLEAEERKSASERVKSQTIPESEKPTAEDWNLLFSELAKLDEKHGTNIRREVEKGVVTPDRNDMSRYLKAGAELAGHHIDLTAFAA